MSLKTLWIADHPEAGAARVTIAADLGGLEMLEARFSPRQACARHSHDTYALGVVHRGVNRFLYRGSHHAAVPGTVCTVTVDEVHAGDVPAEDGLHYRCLYPSADAVADALGQLEDRSPRSLACLPPVIPDPTTFALLDALFDAQNADAPALERQSLYLSLLTRVLAVHAETHIQPRRVAAPQRGIARAHDRLIADVTETASLGELAAEAGLSPYQLLRGFSRSYGLPPHLYLTQVRVRRAKRLILAGVTLAEAAAMVGFADQSHLNRHFRRIVGVTPGRYQRAARAAGDTARR
jgi:AraC-like DNA-binding protein